MKRISRTRVGRVTLPLLVVVILLAAALGPCLGASGWYDRVVVTKNLRLGTAAAGPECVLLGAGAKSGGEYALRVSATYDTNAVDIRCSSAGNTAARWAHAGAFYIKQAGAAGSACAVRGYAYSEKTDGANAGEICGVYGIGEQHGGTSGSISAAGKLVGVRSRITIPTGLTISTGNYYGLLIQTDIQSSIASATESAYIKIEDLRAGSGLQPKAVLRLVGLDAGTANTNVYKTDIPSSGTIVGALKVWVNGTELWIPLLAKGS
ncbi:MAG TPA: hypothetical protein VMX94_07135 [Armatimonadota bacterium]|nr:hypothetical protein [Armatimonadota bacterium]